MSAAHAAKQAGDTRSVSSIYQAEYLKTPSGRRDAAQIAAKNAGASAGGGGSTTVNMNQKFTGMNPRSAASAAAHAAAKSLLDAGVN